MGNWKIMLCMLRTTSGRISAKSSYNTRITTTSVARMEQARIRFFTFGVISMPVFL